MANRLRADAMLPLRWLILLVLMRLPFVVLGGLLNALHVVAERLTWYVDDTTAWLRRTALSWSGVTSRLQAEEDERRKNVLAQLDEAIANNRRSAL